MRLEYATNRGRVTMDSDAPPIVLTEDITGLGGTDGNVHTAATPMQDGVTWLGSTAEPRMIAITGAIVGDDTARAALRREITRVMSAKAGLGLATITAYGYVRQIGAVVERAPAFCEAEGEDVGFQMFTCTLYCPQPFFEDVNVRACEMTARDGGIKFPLRLPAKFSVLHNVSRYRCVNTGDVPCAIEAEFSAGALNPVLTNTSTGEYIRIRRDIPSGHSLVITTGFNDKAAYLKNLSTGECTDAMGYLDLNSTFFRFDPGDNWLNFDADEGRQNTRVNVKWRPAYVAF